MTLIEAEKVRAIAMRLCELDGWRFSGDDILTSINPRAIHYVAVAEKLAVELSALLTNDSPRNSQSHPVTKEGARKVCCVECYGVENHEADCAIAIEQAKHAEFVALRQKVRELEQIIAGKADPVFAGSFREELRARLIGEMAAKIKGLEADATQLKKMNARLVSSREFYQKRLNLIQAYQRLIPDPYRQIICNIIANGGYSASLNEEKAIVAAIEESRKG